MLTVESDRKTASQILSLIKEEEVRSDDIKKRARTAAIAAADAIDSSGAAAEQSFNREQVQEHSKNRSKNRNKRKKRKKKKKKLMTYKKKNLLNKSTHVMMKHHPRGI